MERINYPSQEIVNPNILTKKNYEHIILWMLFNNDYCEWSDFTNDPLKIPEATLSRHLNILYKKGFIIKVSRGQYQITEAGRRRYNVLSQPKGKKKKLSYPPEIILKSGRNYDHWILWMVYNNEFCKRSDFSEEPLSINQHALSKNLNYLFESGFIQKDEQFFKISQSGKLEYSKMLRNYDLDRQTILEEESKRVDDITANTTRFFDKYNINDEDIKFRFLNKVLKFSYSKVSSILTEEEDFFKILLFISINHPSYYPNYISIEDFSELYDIKKKVLDFWIDEIVLGRIFDNKIYRIETSRDKYYFFESNEKLEKILRAITEEHVTKHRYLEKFGRFESNEMLISNILNEICELLFNKDLRSSLQYFLPEYIKHLAYKIEIKRKLLDTYDKLEGIIWQNMATIFHSESSEKLEDQYREDIKEINRSIAVNPKNYELYNEKIRILIYFNQYTELLNLLDEIIKYFPEKEIELLMKKASVLKLKQDINAGLGIIEDLIGKHPDNLELKNYKAYWLQYLGKKEEAIEILNQLIKADPENAIYHDTFGEILMNFNEFEEAAKKFLKAIVLDNAGWFIYQTYIKLGSCYLALEKFDLAEKNLKTGKEKVEEYVKDLDTRQNWLAIADLLLMEIREQKS